MTIRDALLRSKTTGEMFMRQANGSCGFCIRWHSTWLYRNLSADDLTADDWESVFISETCQPLAPGASGTANASGVAGNPATDCEPH